MKFGGDVVTAESVRFLAIHKDRGNRAFACTWERYADIRVFAFARAIDDAAHNGNIHFFYARVILTPLRHIIIKGFLNVLCKFLEERTGGASTAWASADLRGK